jgi:hypothetical protein
MPTRNADKSILNGILNFVGRKSFTDECSDCQFYITLFDHLIENALGTDAIRPFCAAGNVRIASLSSTNAANF